MSHSTGIPRSRQLYIAHLAHRLDAMESGRTPIDAVAYRLWSRRLRQSLAGCPEPVIARGLALRFPGVAEALEQRQFDTHGRLPGAEGLAVAVTANRLFESFASNPG